MLKRCFSYFISIGRTPTCLQTRYLVAIAASILHAIFYVMRINLSVSIVAIALDTGQDTAKLAPHYRWNAIQRGNVISSFFWGYTLLQIPAIYATKKIGPTHLVTIMTVLSSLFTVFFVPAAATFGWQGACIARALLGFSQSGLMASTHQLLAKWSPPSEIGRMVVCAYSGQPLGIIIALAGSGYISENIGWPWVYYISGLMGLILTLCWTFIVADTPSQHTFISNKEKRFIESSILSVETEKKTVVKTIDTKNLDIPWKDILKSGPFWSLLSAQCAMSWGYWTALSGIPSYMKGVLEFNLAEDGLLSALPYVAMWSFSLFLGYISDELIKKQYWGVGKSRKIGSSISLYGSAIAFVMLCSVKADAKMIVSILTIAVGLTAGSLVGHTPNHIDLAPNYASALMGIANQVSCFTAILAPLVIGAIVTDNQSEAEWKLVFLITAFISVIGNTVFVMFGSGKEQPWNNPEHQTDNDTETDKTLI